MIGGLLVAMALAERSPPSLDLRKDREESILQPEMFADVFPALGHWLPILTLYRELES